MSKKRATSATRKTTKQKRNRRRTKVAKAIKTKTPKSKRKYYMAPNSMAASNSETTAASKPAKVSIAAAKGRPMLIWVGKRPLSHVTAFPSQLVERHDALRIIGIDAQNIEAHDEKIQLFRDLRSQCNEECWRDAPFVGVRAPEVGGLLFHGDNKDVLAYLLASGYRNRVNLIYIDPPFDSGADYVRKVKLRGVEGSAKLDGHGYTIGEQIQYTDIWANDNYLQFMFERLLLLKELLSSTGSIVLHADSTRGHQLRCLLDEVFGQSNFRNEITWRYVKYQMGNIGQFVDNTDRLYWYSNGDSWTYNLQMITLDTPKELLAKGWDKEKKVIVNLRDEFGKTYKISIGEEKLDDFWELPFEGPVTVSNEDGERVTLTRFPSDNAWLLPYIAAPSHERTGYPTQKPEIVLEKVIQACSNEGDLILDAFSGTGTTLVVAQQLGRRWIGCDINKGAIQTSVKRLRSVMSDQIADARVRSEDARQGKLIETGAEDEPAPSKPCAFGFTVWRVNDFDLQIQHNEAVNLACEFIGVERSRADSYFEGTLGKKLVKIVPFGHPLTPLDLEELKRELESRPDEDRNIVVVCLGMELASKPWVDDWNRLRRGRDAVNRIEIIELRTDAKYGKFIKHEPASARVKFARKTRGEDDRIIVEVTDFISPTILERLRDQAGLLSPKIDDWRSMVDCIFIDTAYDGAVLNVALADVPRRKSDLVNGKYDLSAPPDETTVAVKIVDMLGEEVLVIQSV